MLDFDELKVPHLLQEHIQIINKPFYLEEITEMVFKLHLDKALGHNGFPIYSTSHFGELLVLK